MKKYLVAIVSLTLTFATASPASESDMTVETAEKVFHACDQVSRSQALDADEAATCSIAYEILLQQKFKGDFDAFLKWWRSHRKGEFNA